MATEIYFPKRLRLRDWIGCILFLFAAVLSGLSAWETPSIPLWGTFLAVLNTFHNALLACLYLVRLPAQRSDNFGLALGLTAALLPAFAGTSLAPISPLWTIVGVTGELFALWSLATLGKRFGIAPADRGLIESGPYRLVRHPMYLGELLLRGALLLGTSLIEGYAALAVLLMIQILRIAREERVINGYPVYASQVRWRLIPFLY